MNDSKLNRARRALLMLLLLAVPSAGVLAQSRGITAERAVDLPLGTGTYRALIIGNSEYRDPQRRWRSLATPLADARAVRDLLRERYGFSDVQLVENATRREILLAMSDLARRVLPDDNVLIYYAGHGFLDPETGTGYWVPVDAQGADHTTFLRNSTIRDELSIVAGRARHTLLISDSCFSGSLLRSGTRNIAPEQRTERYYAEVASKKSVQIISAGGLEFVDDNYGASGHSPFTYFLLNSLQHNRQTMLAASELATEVTRAVANNVEQVPESGVLHGVGDELGEFIFLRVDVRVEGVPAERVKVEVHVSPAPAVEAAEPAPPAPASTPPAARPLAPLPTL